MRTLVDKTERLVSLEDLQVVDAKFPSAPEQEQAYTQALREVLPKNIKSVSLDRLEAQLDIQQAQSKSEALPLQNAPPRIVFMQKPSMLVYIDGEPQYVPVEGTKLTRVVNTRVLLLKDSEGQVLSAPAGWLHGGERVGRAVERGEDSRRRTLRRPRPPHASCARSTCSKARKIPTPSASLR